MIPGFEKIIMYNQAELKKIIDKALISLTFDAESERLFDPVRYVLSIGGKRLRPVLALMSYNLFSDKIDDAVMPVTGLEIFHNFTLVHDDIMDQALIRRNMASVHSKWNINQAILSGDVMAFIANECFLHSPARILQRVLKIFNRAAINVCIGQQLDMDFEKASVVTQEEYLKMIELKTAALIAASAKIGACFGDTEEKNCELMGEFGKNIGLAFQIQDDLLDLYGDTVVFGKVHGGDIAANKKTFLYIKAVELGNTEQKKNLQELFRKDSVEPESKIMAVKAIYNQLNIKKITEAVAGSYIRTALNTLDLVEMPRERKEELIDLTDSLLGREH